MSTLSSSRKENSCPAPPALSPATRDLRNGQGTPPGFLNSEDWRLLFEQQCPKITKKA